MYFNSSVQHEIMLHGYRLVGFYILRKAWIRVKLFYFIHANNFSRKSFYLLVRRFLLVFFCLHI